MRQIKHALALMGIGQHLKDAAKIIIEQETSFMLEEIIDRFLSKREQKIIRQYFFERKTLCEIGKKHRCSGSSIQKIKERSIRKLSKGFLIYKNEKEIECLNFKIALESELIRKIRSRELILKAQNKPYNYQKPKKEKPIRPTKGQLYWIWKYWPEENKHLEEMFKNKRTHQGENRK